VQGSFEFNFQPEFCEDDFVVSSSNSYAWSFIDKWPDWAFSILLLYGPTGSGKSHLTRIWQKKSNAIELTARDVYRFSMEEGLMQESCFILEDISQIHDEVALLHFFNTICENQKCLLMTAPEHPSNLGIRLPDLRSRLNATVSAGLSEPDDALVKALLVKHFTDRQLLVPPNVVDYLVTRVERTSEGVAKVVDLLDRQNLTEQRSITINLARKVLSAAEE
jgi:chromosomal replication initiation ATPase DnaA